MILLLVFRRFRNKGRKSTQRSFTQRSSNDPETRDSLVSKAAPMGSRSENNQPATITIPAPAATTSKPWTTIFTKSRPARPAPEDDLELPSARTTLHIAADEAQDAVSPVSPDLAQQGQPAPSVNCPVQRLQNRLRQHNSTDPRPRSGAPRPVASASAKGDMPRGVDAGVSSSARSTRFSFGLLLQPSFDLFKFKDGRGSSGGRWSGWSSWFKMDDDSGGRPRGNELGSQGKEVA